MNKLNIRHFLSYNLQKHYLNQFSIEDKLDCLNRIWYFGFENFTVYKSYKDKHKLPNKIYSLEEFDSWPDLKKENFKEYQTSILKEANNFDSIVSTGGSTGVPFKIPSNHICRKIAKTNALKGKTANGLDPFNKTVLIWGHSHIFKKSFYLNLRKNLGDFLHNYKRFNAYNLNNVSISKIVDYILSNKIQNIIGYSNCLHEILYFALENNIKFHKSYWIFTAETFNYENLNIYKDLNVVPVVEYGSVEFGPIAYSISSVNDIKVFDTFHTKVSSEKELIITDLVFGKPFPFIKFNIEDLIFTNKGRWNKILGRSNDLIQLDIKGKQYKIHSELFTHIIKSFVLSPFNISFNEKEIHVHFKNFNKIDSNDLNRILTELKKELGSFITESIHFDGVYEIKKSKSGKHKFVYEKN